VSGLDGAYRIEADALVAEVLPYGAHLVGVWFPDRNGDASQNLVAALPDAAAYRDRSRNQYFGSTVGRYANRISSASFDLDGVTCRLDANDGANSLHGGSDGFSRREWDVVGRGESAITLSLVSPAGDMGFPGCLDVSLTYSVVDDALIMSYLATTDAPTVVNLTNHAYWNLAGSMSVMDHTLRVGGDRFVPVDDDLVPTGTVEHVAGTRFDLRQPTLLSQRSGGFDHCFVGDDIDVELTDLTSGRTMTMSTDQPGVQVYTANGLDPQHSHICLEPQALPDAPNQPEFPSTTLRPGDTYRHLTIYRFSRSPEEDGLMSTG